MRPRTIAWTLIVFSVLCHSVFAQTPTTADLNELRAQIDALKADYDKRIQMLEAQLQALQNQSPSTSKPETPVVAAAPPQQQQQPAAQVPTGAQGAGGPGGALPVYGGTGGEKVFNPDIAVIGDFLGAIGSNKVNPNPALQMHESDRK